MKLDTKYLTNAFRKKTRNTAVPKNLGIQVKKKCIVVKKNERYRIFTLCGHVEMNTCRGINVP